MRYRFDGTIFVYGFIYKRLFLFATANKLCVFILYFLDLLLFRCNLMTYVISLIIVRKL